MAISRRALLRGLAPTVAFPYLLRSDPVQAGVTVTLADAAIELGKDLPGGNSGVNLAAFDNGDFVAGWANSRQFFDWRPFIQKFSRAGAPISDPIQLGGGPLTDGIPTFDPPFPVTFPNNSSLVFFSTDSNNSGTGLDVFVQRFSESFSTSFPSRISSSRSGAQLGPLATPLSDGNVQVLWESVAPDFKSSTIRGLVVKPNGVPLTSERTLIRSPAGTNTPRSLTFMPNGDAILSYSEVSSDGQGKHSTNILQRIRKNAPLGTPRRFPSTKASRPFGSFGLPRYDRDDGLGPDDDVGYFVLPPATGKVGQLRQYATNFGSLPDDDPVDTFRVDPASGEPPRVVPIDIGTVPYSMVFLRTEASTGRNTMTLLLIRKSDARVMHRQTVGFPNDSLTVASAVELPSSSSHTARLAVGVSHGNNAFDGRVRILRASVARTP